MGTLLASVQNEATGIFDQAEDKERVEIFIKHPLVKPRRITHHLIVCGNCAGDERLPRKTFLAADSTCATCGGRSYLLAAKLQIPKKGKEPDEYDKYSNSTSTHC